MRRVILTIGGTAAGLAALLSFKTHSAADVSAAGAAGTGAMPSPSAAATSPSTGGSIPAKGKSGGTGSAGSSGSAGGKTVTGKVENTSYGPMQVQLVLTGKKISKVNVLQQTNTGAMSAQIDAMAIPKLTSETLTAQSARIDAVSGCTYTSQGYIQSLQSAVDAAGL
jgi:uncharacterized protein with FMN-binding domain